MTSVLGCWEESLIDPANKKKNDSKKKHKKYKNEHKHTVKFTKEERDIYMTVRNKKEKNIHTNISPYKQLQYGQSWDQKPETKHAPLRRQRKFGKEGGS